MMSLMTLITVYKLTNLIQSQRDHCVIWIFFIKTYGWILAGWMMIAEWWMMSLQLTIWTDFKYMLMLTGNAE